MTVVRAMYENVIEQRTQKTALLFKGYDNCMLYVFRFAGQTLSSKSLVLVTIKMQENDQANISVNCEKMVIGSMLLNEIKSHLRN
jgi:AP-3 complex subunit beta